MLGHFIQKLAEYLQLKQVGSQVLHIRSLISAYSPSLQIFIEEQDPIFPFIFKYPYLHELQLSAAILQVKQIL